jgi:hypothetical protein
MRRLLRVGAVAALALLASGCGNDFGRYQKWSSQCRLDLASGEIVCWRETSRRGVEAEFYILMPAGRYSESWNAPASN